MRASKTIDQLPANADLLAFLANRSLHNIPDTKFPPDLLYVDSFAFVRETRIAGDYEQPPDARERRDDLLSHPICEIFLLGVAAQICKGQHSDRRLFR